MSDAPSDRRIHVTAVRLWRDGEWKTYPIDSPGLDKLLEQDLKEGGSMIPVPKELFNTGDDS